MTAGEVRALGLELEWQFDPNIERHTGIVGWPKGKSKIQEKRNQLVDGCDWHGTAPPLPHPETPVG